MIAGVITQTSGNIYIDQQSPSSYETKKNIFF